MLLLIVIVVGVALAFYPSWRLVAAINVVLFVGVTAAGTASGEAGLASAGTALLYLFAISITFVATSLALDHVLDRKAQQHASGADRISRLAWTGESEGSARPPAPPTL